MNATLGRVGGDPLHVVFEATHFILAKEVHVLSSQVLGVEGAGDMSVPEGAMFSSLVDKGRNFLGLCTVGEEPLFGPSSCLGTGLQHFVLLPVLLRVAFEEGAFSLLVALQFDVFIEYYDVVNVLIFKGANYSLEEPLKHKGVQELFEEGARFAGCILYFGDLDRADGLENFTVLLNEALSLENGTLTGMVYNGGLHRIILVSSIEVLTILLKNSGEEVEEGQSDVLNVVIRQQVDCHRLELVLYFIVLLLCSL